MSKPTKQKPRGRVETAVEKLNLCISLSEDESLELLKNVQVSVGEPSCTLRL